MSAGDLPGYVTIYLQSRPPHAAFAASDIGIVNACVRVSFRVSIKMRGSRVLLNVHESLKFICASPRLGRGMSAKKQQAVARATIRGVSFAHFGSRP